jgi:anti-sigma regulatory factor (Ser/Thr protein kinase)
VRPGRRGELLEVPEGPPLGILEDVIWRERTLPLPTSSTLVLYTDGLIERRSRPYSTGEQQLLDLCERLPDTTADHLADTLLTLAGVGAAEQHDHPAEPTEDDTALLLLRWPGDTGTGTGTGEHVRTLPVTPSSAVIARWYVDDLLLSWGVADDSREIAVLLTDEVVANAARHAHRTIQLGVTAREGDVLVEVFDDSHREPSLSAPELDATSGRGLRLVDALATAWGVRTSQGDLGKTVWFTVDLKC